MAETAKVGVLLSLLGASSFARGLGKIAGGFGTIRGAVSAAAADTFHFLQIGKDVANMIRRLGGGAINLANALTGPNEQFEISTLQFEQLLGSADKARARIEELYRFAATTPFLNPDVLKAGKLLQAFGGDALGAGDALRMVGDMAAYASTDMAEVAMWVARAYSAIEGGRPFGEAAQRLQELALLTGQERNALETLSESGATSTEVWAAFVKTMSKTRDSAKRLSDSFQGAKSTVVGLWSEVKRLAGARLFEAMKADTIELRDDLTTAFDAGRVSKFAEQAGAVVANLYAGIKQNLLGGLSLETLFSASEAGKLGELLTTVLQGAASNFGRAIYNAALEYGPDIQRAMIPTRLHGILGISAERQAALARMAGGQSSSKADLKGLGWMERGNLSAVENLTENQLFPEQFRQVYAEQRMRGRNPLPMVDLSAQIAALGLSSGGAAQAPAAAGVDFQSLDQTLARSFAALRGHLDATEESAAKLADRMVGLSAQF